MADEFVQNFVALSHDDRREALNKLTRVLASDERQAVIDAIHGKNDIVPALPFELLLQVFSHLPILDAWSLQLVNRRWGSALSSDQFLRAALSRWDSHDPSDSSRSLESKVHDSTRDRILHMQSLRLGKPFLQAGVGDRGTGYEGPRPQFSQRRFDMKGSRIAYISSKRGDSDTVCTRDLVTGHELSFYDGTRERVHSVAISSDLVAKVTFSGRLYYTKFSAPQSGQMLVLPSAYIRAVGAHGLAVAVAVGAVGPNAGHVTEILYYDERTFSGLRSIDVAASAKELQDGMRSLNACQILVDSDNKVFDVFTLVYKPGHTIRSLVLLHLRVAFAGDVLARIRLMRFSCQTNTCEI